MFDGFAIIGFDYAQRHFTRPKTFDFSLSCQIAVLFVELSGDSGLRDFHPDLLLTRTDVSQGNVDLHSFYLSDEMRISRPAKALYSGARGGI